MPLVVHCVSASNRIVITITVNKKTNGGKEEDIKQDEGVPLMREANNLSQSVTTCQVS